MPDDVAHYSRYRFPPAIISHAVWLYYRFTLTFRDVEDLLAQRGITASYESIQHWCEGIVKTLAVCCDAAMSQPLTRSPLYRGYRFPPEIISWCVWLYYRFSVSLRDGAELMLARGIEVS